MRKVVNMDNYIRVLFQYRWFVVIIVPLFVLFSLINLQNLEIDGSYRIWFEKDSPKLQAYDNFRSDFSNDNGITITFKDENGIFTKKALSSISRITEALWNLEYIDKVSSLTNYQYIYTKASVPDEVILEDFIHDIDQAAKSYFEERKRIALHDPILLHGLISADAKTTIIFARLDTDTNKNGDISAKIMDDLQNIVAQEAKKTGYKYWLNGGPAITHAFVNIAEHDVKLFTPLVFFMAILLLYLMFRKFSGAIIPMFVVSFTFVIVLSVQVLLGYKLNNFTANLPVFIMAIGIADAVHIYSVWLLKRRAGYDNYSAVKEAMETNFLPIFLTSLTTLVGFLTLAVSHVVPVATLGIATASGAFLAFVISVLWMPALLLVMHIKIKTVYTVSPVSYRKSYGYGTFILKHRKKIVFAAVVLIVTMGCGLPQIKVDSNIIRYFDQKEEVRKAAEFTMNNLTGSMSYAIVVDSKQKDGVKDPAFLNAVEHFYQDFQQAYPNDLRHLFSILDIIKRYNKVLNHQEKVPKRKNLIAQYMLLYTMSLPEGVGIADRVDFMEQKLYIRVLMNMVDASKELEIIEFINQWWHNNTPYDVVVTGQAILYAYMQKDVSNTLIYSFVLTLLIISIIMFLIFKRFNIVWILLLPNILPVILVLGLMGWIGIPIDMGVAITGAIIIGVAIDDTIHFLVKYFELREQGIDVVESLDQVLFYVGKAIIFTTIVLSVSFSVFVFSDFTPNQKFGFVTTTALLIALVVDLLFLPALLSFVEEKNKVKK